MNYGELLAAVRAYLYDRTDLESMLPVFVALSERRIYRLLRVPAHEALMVIEEHEGPSFALPRDYLECKLLTVADRPLTRISDTDYLHRRRIAGEAGTPEYFARLGRDVHLWRQPDSPARVEMIYWQDLSGQLSLPDDTNEILRIAPDLYVYGALIEAMPYLAQSERTPEFNALFDQAVAQINNQAIESEYSGSTVAVGQVYGDEGRY